ncbi:hypothetical protein PF005_g19010 [Phytophthora fragariae]|uniref:Uncharacterized protein n=1 Tax=Phytophthora fragariae TaxID=53985 RepID=A0A6A3E4R4_9STRA|nr:hypothetical protein PF003_g12612 [Phytophthora fragariae]KAE8928575.1 hypothetical protein PF009_g21284 [Phytophthora fragariae]KAE8991727.1 hypothetical protein PF011_g17833 [Phytophthora fragariae]KAE9074255.1 hypothetical protein PF006_g28578 [Phytophthora fragariae]KAE9086302.1 hypothetical protein PF007_g20824 [Phytophthora fragariae]
MASRMLLCAILSRNCVCVRIHHTTSRSFLLSASSTSCPRSFSATHHAISM